MTPIETGRLILRRFTPEDYEAVHSYAGVAENITYMPFRANTPAQTHTFLSIAMAQAEEKPCVNHQYAVVCKESNVLIGGCNLAIDGEEGEIGWILHRGYWRQGYGIEIGKALLDFAFDRKGLHRVTAHCDGENIGSYRVMEKIGMRREGHFLGCRKGGRYPNGVYGDEYAYAITRGEWEANRESVYYSSLPCIFEGFIDLSDCLSDGHIYLVCLAKKPGNPEKKWVPSYDFAICRGGEKIGDINLRIGYGGGLQGSNLYYGGQIGYSIEEEHRGNGYAAAACRLLLPVAKAHGMEKLLITNEHTNTASRRVCEKLGARLLRVARLPQWHDLYEEGQRFVNIYEWNVG